MITTKTIHHINKDFTHEVIETITTIFGLIVKRKFETIIY